MGGLFVWGTWPAAMSIISPQSCHGQVGGTTASAAQRKEKVPLRSMLSDIMIQVWWVFSALGRGK